MFSGKSEELCRRVNRLLIAKREVRSFKPKVDERSPGIQSHSGFSIDGAIAINEKNPSEILQYVDDNVEAVAIDEAQFFTNELIGVIDQLIEKGMRVIVAGLDTDYMRRPWEPIPSLMALANPDSVAKLGAVCMAKTRRRQRCGQPANCTQRISGGSQLIEIGANDKYEARCLTHYEPPSK
jgi:thymidine kinase